MTTVALSALAGKRREAGVTTTQEGRKLGTEG